MSTCPWSRSRRALGNLSTTSCSTWRQHMGQHMMGTWWAHGTVPHHHGTWLLNQVPHHQAREIPMKSQVPSLSASKSNLPSEKYGDSCTFEGNFAHSSSLSRALCFSVLRVQGACGEALKLATMMMTMTMTMTMTMMYIYIYTYIYIYKHVYI